MLQVNSTRKFPHRKHYQRELERGARSNVREPNRHQPVPRLRRISHTRDGGGWKEGRASRTRVSARPRPGCRCLVWRSATAVQSSLRNFSSPSSAAATSLYALSSAMADITQRLPPGLFIKILCHVSTPDVLRVKQVKRLSLSWTNSLSAVHICRSTVSSTTRSLHLRWFNSR